MSKLLRPPNKLAKKILGLGILLLWLEACQGENQTAKKLVEDSAAAQQLKSNLIFKNVILEQANEKGQLWWKVKSNQADYTKDQQTAIVQNPDGEFYQDGQLVYRIKATKGEVKQDGQTIFLRGNIVATAVKDQAVLTGKEVEWRPKEDLLIVRQQVNGTHAQIQATATEARVFSRARRMEFFGQVIAVAKDPPLQMRGEHLVWNMAKQEIISDRPIQIDRYQGANVTDRGLGNQGEVNLKTKISLLKQNAQITLLEPPVQIYSNLLTWNLDAKKVVSDQPIQIVHRQQPMILNAEQGWVDLEKKICYLIGKVTGVNTEKKSQMRADQMTWFLPTQEIAAEGNVFYQQTDPPLNLNGPKGFGKLQDQTVVITGNTGGRVVTQIIP